MAAPTHVVTPTARSAGRTVPVRLRWWALALPLAAFGALLLLPLSGGGSGDDSAARSPVSQILERVQGVLTGG
jgi:hypothetical protein